MGFIITNLSGVHNVKCLNCNPTFVFRFHHLERAFKQVFSS